MVWCLPVFLLKSELKLETTKGKSNRYATESAVSDSAQSKLLKPILILIVGIRTYFIYDWNVESIDTEEPPSFNYYKKTNRVKIKFKEVTSQVVVWGLWIYLAVKMLVRENVLKKKKYFVSRINYLKFSKSILVEMREWFWV